MAGFCIASSLKFQSGNSIWYKIVRIIQSRDQLDGLVSFHALDGNVECSKFLCLVFFYIDLKKSICLKMDCILCITKFALLIATYFYLSFRFIAKGESGGEARFVYLQVSKIYSLLENYCSLNIKVVLLKKELKDEIS